MAGVKKNYTKEIDGYDLGTTIAWMNVVMKEMSIEIPKVLKGRKSAARRLRVLTIRIGLLGKRYRVLSAALKHEPRKTHASYFKGMPDAEQFAFNFIGGF